MLRKRQNYSPVSAAFIRHPWLQLVCFLTVIAAMLSVGCNRGAKTSASKETQTGLASFYGQGLQGNKTASGEIFDKDHMIAAHPKYPFGTKVRVTNLENERAVEVQIVDRGPTRDTQAEGVIIDVSEGAAKKLDILKDGRARVKLDVLEWGSLQDKK